MFARASGKKLPQSSVGSPEGTILFLEGVSENTKSNILSAFVLPRIAQPEDEASTQKRQCYEQNGHEDGILRRICILD